MAALVDLSAAARHRAVAAGFTEHVAAVDDWSSPTPVADWTAADIVYHLVDWSTEFLCAGGVQFEAASHTRPAADWARHCAAVQHLLDGPESAAPFTHPFAGSHRLADAIDRFYTADVFQHTWDLATACGRKSGLDAQFAEHLLTGMAEIDELLRSSGQYGPAVRVPDGADAVTRLAGFIGRDPYWRA